MCHEKLKDMFSIFEKPGSDPVGHCVEILALGQSCSPVDTTPLLLTFDHC